MDSESKKHYPTYLVLVIGMVTSFFLGVLLVEIPFSVGLDYFHDIARENLVAKQVRAYQQQNAVRMAEITDSDAQRSVLACRAQEERCAQVANDALTAGRVSDAEWLTEQVACATEQRACMADIDL